VKYLLAITYFVIFSSLLRIFVRYNMSTYGFGIICLLVVCAASVFNDSSGLIEEKFASFVAYDMYKGFDFQLGFFVQYALTWIPFQLLDEEYVAHGLNIGLQAFIFMIGARYIFNLKPSLKLVIFMLFPSYYHYAIFGLRDPLINLVTIAIAIGALQLDKRQFILLCLSMSVLTIGIRAEFSLIILGFALLREFIDSAGKRRVLIGMCALIGLYGALSIMPIAFGLPISGNPLQNIETMTQFNELRNARRLGEDGSGSHILGGTLFSYPFLIRYPIQVAGSFLAPLPFELRGSLDLIAFAESLAFCGVSLWAAAVHRKNERASILFWCGMMYMLLQAIFAINYGNILRIRYPCLVLFLAAIVAAESVFYNKSMENRVRRRT